MSERWKPKSGEEYWVVIGGAAIISTWRSDYADNYRWGMGNCFKTKAEAESAAEKVKALLLSLHYSETLQANDETLQADIQDKQTVTNCNQLPKLTAEVFNRPDCPEWAKYAAVNSNGTLIFFGNKPKFEGEDYGCWSCDDYQYTHIKHIVLDASDWQNSLIERPVKQLPDWCKVGEWVWINGRPDKLNYFGYGKITQVAPCIYVQFGVESNEQETSITLDCLSQARLRPYNADEMKALVGEKVMNNEGNIYLCTAFIKENHTCNAAVDIDSWVTAGGLQEYGYTINGKPCGVLEHLENGEWVE